MNGTADKADLLLRITESVREENGRLFQAYLQRVSNNLGVYFLSCLFGLAILALFLWSSMQALQTSLFFFVLRRQVWQVFMYQ